MSLLCPYCCKFVILFNVSCLSSCLSIASIAKALSVPDNPSIIMTKVCLLYTPFSMGMSSLNFTKLESGEKSLDTNLIPNKGTNSNHFITYLIKITSNTHAELNTPEINEKNVSMKIFIVGIVSHYKLIIEMLFGKLNYSDELYEKGRRGLKIEKVLIKGFIADTVSHQKLIRKMFFDKRNYSDESCEEGRSRFLILLQAGDIETNPGPEDLLLVSQNCRGLKNNEKLKQLLNACHSMQTKGSKIIALQETHLEKSMLNYLWSGNYALTPSQGAKGGVITLLGPNAIIHEQRDIKNECHVLLIEIISKLFQEIFSTPL